MHRNYQPVMASIPPGRIKGAAHITGGGLIDNLPRILPATCDALIDTSSWKVPPIFRLIQRGGDISREEMYQVFNMGIGMVLVVSKSHASERSFTNERKGDWTNYSRFWQGPSRLKILLKLRMWKKLLARGRRIWGVSLGAGLLGAFVLTLRYALRPSAKPKLPDAISPAIFATRIFYTSRGQVVYHESGQGGSLGFSAWRLRGRFFVRMVKGLSAFCGNASGVGRGPAGIRGI